MSSTSKTEHYHLNAWVGTDIPKMEDFNRDNALIDAAMHTHQADTDIHITASERGKWNSPYYLFSYTGNGSSSRTIAMECTFNPSWGAVYSVGKPSDITDFSNQSDYNYLGLVSRLGSMNGLTLNGKQLTVTQSATAAFGSEYKSFNENGSTYICIMFR